MARRHLVDRRLTLLDDVRGIMDSIKTLAQMEIQRLSPSLPAQQEGLARVRGMARDFAAQTHFPLPEKPEAPLLVVIGAERGLCGDFNGQLADRLHQLTADGQVREFIAVGTRLGLKLENHPGLSANVPGAAVAEDIPAVLRNLLDVCGNVQGQHGPLSLALLFHDARTGSLRLDPVLSPFYGAEPASAERVLFNLTPQQFLPQLLQQYLYSALFHAASSSLLAENQKRLMHLENAVNHLDEERERLVRKRNRLYQEDIITELEIVMLAAESSARPGQF